MFQVINDGIVAAENIDCSGLLLPLSWLIVVLLLMLFRVVLVVSKIDVRDGTADGRTI